MTLPLPLRASDVEDLIDPLDAVEITAEAESIVDLGEIVTGRVAPRNGPTDVTLYRESRGGVHDAALANRAFERAHELGRGVEFDFR
jgi:ornithine cyclodeaminase/alanine dehydrogenase-like protein (mu-crystallin family)